VSTVHLSQRRHTTLAKTCDYQPVRKGINDASAATLVEKTLNLGLHLREKVWGESNPEW
jgi:hypothetical protein